MKIIEILFGKRITIANVRKFNAMQQQIGDIQLVGQRL